MKLQEAYDALQEPDIELLIAAMNRVRQGAGPKAKASLAILADHHNARVRCNALRYLGMLNAYEAMGTIAHHALHDRSPRARCISVAALACLKRRIADLHMVDSLQDDDELVVQTALSRLAIRGAKSSVPEIRRLLVDRRWTVRLEACNSLTVLGSVDETVIDTLKELSLCHQAVSYNEQVAISRQLTNVLFASGIIGDIDSHRSTIGELFSSAADVLATLNNKKQARGNRRSLQSAA